MKILKILLGNPIRAAALVFLSISMPVNYFFLDEHPNNPLERMEEYVIQHVLGIDIDIHEQEDKLDELIDELTGKGLNELETSTPESKTSSPQEK